ncbi:hypothetical protein Hypma_013431 [Hypsizygus marmoreus]|uniref:Uncharacterized protein n=1 Tax=Hypsizygus marmoreus TaxID=39966 RepID=A0A369JF30_HYPMA|nr:hypothetical protein Hypma_013431 [Hypsizygus marmoreus]
MSTGVSFSAVRRITTSVVLGETSPEAGQYSLMKTSCGLVLYAGIRDLG